MTACPLPSAVNFRWIEKSSDYKNKSAPEWTRFLSTLKRLLRRNHRITPGHSGSDMVIDVAVIHPDANIIRDHIRNHGCRGQQFHDILAMTIH